jgi:hypothetical protein
MFPPNNTPTPGSTPAPAQNQPQNTPDYLTKEEFSKSAAFIRGLSDRLETLTKTVPTMDLFVQLGMLEKSEDGSYKPKAGPSTEKPAEKAPEPEWKGAVEELKKSLKAKEDELTAERQRATEVEKKNAVISALSKAGAVNPGRDAVHILSGIHKNDKGDYVARGKDDLGLDTETGLEDFIGKFLQQNPELKKASGHSGSGTPASANTSSGTTITREQMSPEWYSKNRDKIVSGEIHIVG